NTTHCVCSSTAGCSSVGEGRIVNSDFFSSFSFFFLFFFFLFLPVFGVWLGVNSVLSIFRSWTGGIGIADCCAGAGTWFVILLCSNNLVKRWISASAVLSF